MDELKKRACNLLTVKSLVTLCLTGVFAALSLSGKVNQEFMTVYTMIVSFYFGTQAVREVGG